MKVRVRVFKILAGIAVLMFVAGGVAHAGSSEGEGIPLPAGQFSYTGQGSEALCFNPASPSPVLEDCSTSGVVVVPINALDNGAASIDSAGNSCSQFTEADSVLPVNAIPPFIQPRLHSVGKVVSYDSATGTGDLSFTNYSGGRCNGATFDNSGATENASGTEHFVVTAGGSRTDFVTTSATTPASAIASFSFSGTLLRQTRPES